MAFTGPAWLVMGLLAAALLAWVLSRWQRVTAAWSVIAALVLWAGVGLTEAGEMWTVYGRSLELTAGVRQLYLLVLPVAALLFGLALVWPTGRRFVPLGLAAQAAAALALMIRPFTFGALAWLAAAVLVAMLIQGERAGHTLTAWRWLTLMALAAPFLLTAGWMLAREAAALQETAVRLLAVAFILLLAGFPFHLWVAPLFTTKRPLVVGYVVGLMPLLAAAFAYQIVLGQGWWTAGEPGNILRISGAATVVAGGMMAATAAGVGRLLGGLVVQDLGLMILTLTLPADQGWETAIALSLARPVGLLAALTGWRWLQAGGAVEEDGLYRGMARRMPEAAALLFYGCWSLWGGAVTPGFWGRWQMVTGVSGMMGGDETAVWLAVILLLGMGGGLYGVGRLAVQLLAQEEAPRTAMETVSETAARQRQGIAGLVLSALLLLALFPQIWLNAAQRLAAAWMSGG